MTLVNHLQVKLGDLILLKSEQLDIQRVGFVSDYGATYVTLDNGYPFNKQGQEIKWKLWGNNGRNIQTFHLKNFDFYKVIEKHHDFITKKGREL